MFVRDKYTLSVCFSDEEKSFYNMPTICTGKTYQPQLKEPKK
jgi:hypothetical protein